MKPTLIFILSLLILVACTKTEEPKNLLLPVPEKIIFGNDYVTLPEPLSIKFSGNFPEEKKDLIQKELENTGIKLGVNSENQISFILNDVEPNENYILNIASEGIRVEASSQAGVYHGLQTLKQLFALQMVDGQWPVVRIEDGPNYSWRGMHLDVSRHFISKDYLLSFIDIMASYKLNKLHLHLTDDQGWRLEIKKYPELTNKGAWRTLDNKLDINCYKKAKEKNDPDYLLPEEHLRVVNGDTLYGGFYTQEDMREIISFAADREIEIIPEIDMPGHILSAANVYPELTCFNKPEMENLSSPLCAGKEEVYEFVENVLTEVGALFPSQYIHIGADEVKKTNWEKCPKCQKRIKDHHLADEHALEGYFVKRINKMLIKQGKTMIAWDEVLSGGMPENTVMMHWRNWNTNAAEQCTAVGNKYVVTPSNDWYLYQRLNRVYNFDPMDPNLSEDKQHLMMGVQTCSWGEEKASENLVSRANIPALQAIAEIGWSKPELRVWDDFIFRLEKHLKISPTAEFKFSKDFMQEFWTNVNPIGDGSLTLKLHAGTSDAKMEVENEKMEKKPYDSPLTITKNTTVKTHIILSDTVITKLFNFSFNKATGRKLQADVKPPLGYGNVSTLIDGLTGGDNYSRDRWIVFADKYFSGTINLGSVMDISEIKIGLLDDNIKDDLPPATFSIELSKDGKTFFSPESLSSNCKSRKGFKKAIDLENHFKTTSAQYVKIKCSDYVPGSDGKKKLAPGWVFMDEVQVN